jgi:hypothetical protein
LGLIPPRLRRASQTPTAAAGDTFGGYRERQRRSIIQPRVGAQRLPWAIHERSINTNGVESNARHRGDDHGFPSLIARLIQPFQG